MGFNSLNWSNDLDDLGVPRIGEPHLYLWHVLWCWKDEEPNGSSVADGTPAKSQGPVTGAFWVQTRPSGDQTWLENPRTKCWLVVWNILYGVMMVNDGQWWLIMVNNHWYITGWWFKEHLDYFPYLGNNHPNWLSYFSEGLKPPTRNEVVFFDEPMGKLSINI